MKEELLHLAATLADQPDHHDIGLGLPGDHAQQHALADAATGEQADALALADGEHGVDGAHADVQRLLHRAALERVDGRQLGGQRVAAAELAEVVERLAEAVDHPAEPGLVDLQARLVARREYPRAGHQPDRLLERHQVGDLAVEADHLGFQHAAVGQLDVAALAGQALAAEAFQQQPGNPRQAPADLGQLHAVERAQRLVELEVGELAHASVLGHVQVFGEGFQARIQALLAADVGLGLGGHHPALAECQALVRH
ncbi:hypothetical protein D9M70_304540 [compost metagenome]